MFGKIIKHKRECVEFYTLNKFKKEVIDAMCLKDSSRFEYDEGNGGVTINGTKYSWVKLASVVEWFDDAEIVTDKNENERVMTWLNV